MDKKLNKQLGIVSENLFINECTSRNIPIFKNQNDIGEIDYIILVNNKALRIQVKSTGTKKLNSWLISTKRTKNRLYQNIDYFACYINKNCWYIIPIKCVENKQAISITEGNDKYSNYKDNWTFGQEKEETIYEYNIDKRNECVSLFKDGYTKSEIARRLNFHYSVINRWLREAGYGIRKLEINKEELEALYSSGKTMKQISNEIGITVWTLRNLFRKYGIAVRMNPNPNGTSKSNKIKELQF